MLKIDIPDKGKAMVAVSGNGKRIVFDLLYAVNRIFNAISQRDLKHAYAFKRVIQELIADDDRKVWEINAVETEITVGYVREVTQDD